MIRLEKFPLMKKEEGYFYCTECNGHGILKVFFEKKGTNSTITCYQCKGVGKISWIDKVLKESKGGNFK